MGEKDNKENKFNIDGLTKDIISLYLESVGKDKDKSKCDCTVKHDNKCEEEKQCKCKHKNDYEHKNMETCQCNKHEEHGECECKCKNHHENKEKEECEYIGDYEYEDYKEHKECKCKCKNNHEYEEECKCEHIGDYDYMNYKDHKCIPECVCPKVNPQHCCSVILEHKTCLVPPYLECGDIKHTAEVEAEIEMVCPGKVIICGVLHKKIEYTALMQNGMKKPCYVKCDDVSFQCYIDADEANEGDKYNIEGVAVVCSKGKPINEGRYRCNCEKVFWAYEEKDVIKIAVKRVNC